LTLLSLPSQTPRSLGASPLGSDRDVQDPFCKEGSLEVITGTDKKEDPPIILNTMYLDRKKENNPPFYLSLGMNGLHLNNCMLDLGPLQMSCH
jgi:hypothetical protein